MNGYTTIFYVIANLYEGGKIKRTHYVAFASLKGAQKYLNETKDRVCNVLGWKCIADTFRCDDESQNKSCYRHLSFEICRDRDGVHEMYYHIEKNILHD